MRRVERTIPLGLKNLSAAAGDHIAYLWETESEFEAATGFLELGLARGEHCVIFGHDEANDAVLRALERRGHDPASLRREERLSVLGAESAGDAMLGRIGETFQRAIDGGAPLIRLLGNIGWGREGWPEEDEILRFEAKVTGAAAAFPCVVICMYDVARLDASVLLHGAFGTHPLTIYGNLIRENPFCVDVETFLARLEQVRAARDST